VQQKAEAASSKKEQFAQAYMKASEEQKAAAQEAARLTHALTWAERQRDRQRLSDEEEHKQLRLQLANMQAQAKASEEQREAEAIRAARAEAALAVAEDNCYLEAKRAEHAEEQLTRMTTVSTEKAAESDKEADQRRILEEHIVSMLRALEIAEAKPRRLEKDNKCLEDELRQLRQAKDTLESNMSVMMQKLARAEEFASALEEIASQEKQARRVAEERVATLEKQKATSRELATDGFVQVGHPDEVDGFVIT
jgi:hypothetical protein